MLHSRVILLLIVEQFAQEIVGFRRGGQQGDGVFQDQLFQYLVGEAQVGGQAFGLFRIRFGGVRLTQYAFRVGLGVILHGAFRRAGGQHIHRVLPEAKADEFIGHVQVFLDPPAGGFVKGDFVGVPAQQRQVQRVDGQAFR